MFVIPNYAYKNNRHFSIQKYIYLRYTTWILQKNIYIVKNTITMPKMTIKRLWKVLSYSWDLLTTLSQSQLSKSSEQSRLQFRKSRTPSSALMVESVNLFLQWASCKRMQSILYSQVITLRCLRKVSDLLKLLLSLSRWSSCHQKRGRNGKSFRNKNVYIWLSRQRRRQVLKKWRRDKSMIRKKEQRWKSKLRR